MKTGTLLLLKDGIYRIQKVKLGKFNRVINNDYLDYDRYWILDSYLESTRAHYLQQEFLDRLANLLEEY